EDQLPNDVGEVRVMPFHEIMPAVRDGAVDAGLVIHEARFTYPNFGLHCLIDLGDWWGGVTGTPIQLGAIDDGRSHGESRRAGVAEGRVMQCHEIMPAVRDGSVDAGLVIQEARFTSPIFGLHGLIDLGDWGEGVTGTPIPLGATGARRSLGESRIAEITRAIR